MDGIGALQWPAMVVTLAAGWLTASSRRHRRWLGFVTFVISNLLWIVWGWHTGAWALIALQFGLFAMNLRGLRENPT